jgi:hypothetical protein
VEIVGLRQTQPCSDCEVVGKNSEDTPEEEKFTSQCAVVLLADFLIKVSDFYFL